MNRPLKTVLPREILNFSEKDGGFIVITGVPGENDCVSTVVRELAGYTRLRTGREGALLGGDEHTARASGLPFGHVPAHLNGTRGFFSSIGETDIGIVVLQSPLTVTSLGHIIDAASSGILVICTMDIASTDAAYSHLLDLQEGGEDWESRSKFDIGCHAVVACKPVSTEDDSLSLSVFVPPARDHGFPVLD